MGPYRSTGGTDDQTATLKSFLKNYTFEAAVVTQLARHALGLISSTPHKLGLVVHTSEPQEVRPRRSEVQSHPKLYSEFEASLNYVSKTKTQSKKINFCRRLCILGVTALTSPSLWVVLDEHGSIYSHLYPRPQIPLSIHTHHDVGFCYFSLLFTVLTHDHLNNGWLGSHLLTDAAVKSTAQRHLHSMINFPSSFFFPFNSLETL